MECVLRRAGGRQKRASEFEIFKIPVFEKHMILTLSAHPAVFGHVDDLMRASLSFQATSKFGTAYTKLFQGLTPKQISPYENESRFYASLLALDVNRPFLEQQLQMLHKETLLGSLKVSCFYSGY